jgi:hypothetical protein
MTRTTTNSEERKSKEDFIDSPQWGEKQRHGGAYPTGVTTSQKRGGD